MNQKSLLVALASLVVAGGSAFANWTLVSSFDDDTALSLITDTATQEGSNARSEIVNGMWAVYPGDLFETNSNLFSLLDLGVDLRAASITSGQPVTLYMEVMQPIVDDGQGGTRKAIVDTVWGPSNVDADEVVATGYNSYNAMQRINSGNDNFEGRNGGSYVAIAPFEANVKYSIWMVIDFNLNYYETYIQGGAWTTQTKLDGGDTTGIWLFRVNPVDPQTVDKLLIALSRGNSVQGEKGLDPTYFDNVAIDTTGVNLNPAAVVAKGPGIFGNYDLMNDTWVATDSFMGSVWVADYPWVYLYRMRRWVYIPDETGTGDPDAGTWMYVPKQ